MLVVRNARLYDGRGLDPVEDGVLVCEGERVTYAGAASSVPAIDRSGTLIDAEGRALVPGLIDCHVHLCFEGAPDFAADALEMSPETARRRCEENVARALEAGITTVRDLGGVDGAVLEIARAVREGRAPGARVLTAGRALTTPGGHGYFIGEEVESVEEIVKAIGDLREAGADCVKVIATGGVLTPGVDAQKTAFPEEHLAAAVVEAHRLGMRVAAHAIGAEGIEAAVRAGVSSIEHGCFLTGSAIKGMIGNPTWLVATLSAPDRIVGGEGVPDYARTKATEVQAAHVESFGHAVEAGARVAAGTDAGTPFNHHGELPYELRLMHRAGMPLDRVLTAATREGATLLGLGDVGTLERGKFADFVLLDGDPLEDVEAYARAVLVVQRGRIVVDKRAA